MKNLIFILLIVLVSCSSRKVLVDKTDIKKDSITETKVVVEKSETKDKKDSTSIFTNTDSSEITIIPIDTSKTIIVDGKSYKNVILNIKKNKSNTLYTNSKKESSAKTIDSAATSKTKVKEQEKTKVKFVDRKADYFGLFLWALLILILYVLWRNKHRLLNVL